MTIATSSAETVILGDGVNVTFTFNFVYNSAADITVTYTNAAGVETVLGASQYTLTLNPPATGQIWGIGGVVTYPISGTPIATGTSLTISRDVPLTQTTTISNQGDFAPEVIEAALDTLEMQIQQVAAGVTANPSAASYVFICGTVTGTANTLVVGSTSPSNFSLNPGTLITFTPAQVNTGTATLNVLGTGAITLQKLTPAGPANLTQGDLVPSPLFAQYTGSVWYVLSDVFSATASVVSGAQSIGIGNTFTPFVCSAATTFTVAITTALPVFWYVDINSLGGAATITPNAADIISANGTALAAGASFVIPRGASCRLFTDGNGHLYINYLNSRFNLEASVLAAGTTDIGSASSNIINITGSGTNINSFGISANISNPLYFIRFTGTSTLVYNSTSMILPSSANIATHVGDTAIAKYEATNSWRVFSYNLAAGTPIAGTGRYKVGSFTYDVSTASGTQAITGVGFTPKEVDFTAAFTSGGNANCLSIGNDDGILAKSWVNTSSTFTPGLDGSNSIDVLTSGGNSAVSHITSFGADGFTLTWTKTGTPTGTITVIYSAKG